MRVMGCRAPERQDVVCWRRTAQPPSNGRSRERDRRVWLAASGFRRRVSASREALGRGEPRGPRVHLLRMMSRSTPGGSGRRPLAADALAARPRGGGRSYRLPGVRGRVCISFPCLAPSGLTGRGLPFRGTLGSGNSEARGLFPAVDAASERAGDKVAIRRRRAARAPSDGCGVQGIGVAAARDQALYFAFPLISLVFEPSRAPVSRGPGAREPRRPRGVLRADERLRRVGARGRRPLTAGRAAVFLRMQLREVPALAGPRWRALYFALLLSCVGFEAARFSIPRDAESLHTRGPLAAPAP